MPLLLIIGDKNPELIELGGLRLLGYQVSQGNILIS